MQGCPLRCLYCHNPDTWATHGGREVEASEIIDEFMKNKAFYSKGGITVTGGEPLMQAEFVAELFALARSYGIHTALDTSGATFSEKNLETIDRVLDYTDLVMLDIKHIDKEKHKKLTGVPSDNILAFAKHLEKRPESIKEEDTPDSLKEAKTSVEALRDERNTRKGELHTRIEADDEAIRKKGDTTVLDQLKEEYEHWNSFHKLFGDANGDKLSRTAQSYVLESLLSNANHHLRNMAPRYRLLVNPGTLNLKLEDQYNDYQTRSTNSISGGESFLVSLALALALADFGQHLGVSMLFIDEGFGTLSGEALTSAINTLKSLHTDSGRQVGIISHREEIRDSIPVQIKVNLAPGTSASTVEVSE
jgi:DNA repair exonuclease SbcCD ATPase subunit